MSQYCKRPGGGGAQNLKGISVLKMLKRLSAQGCYPLAVGLAYSRNNSETQAVHGMI